MKLLPTFVGTPEVNRVYNTDALTLLRAMPDNSVDMILTDPPYGVHEAEWDTAPDLTALWVEIRRILKPRSAVVFTAVQPFTTDLIVSNRDWFKYCWVWSKTIAGDFFNAKNKPMRKHEDIVVFSNGTTANGSDNKMQYYPQGLIAEQVKHSRPYSSKFRRDADQIVSTRASWKTEYVSEQSNYPSSVLHFAHGNNLTEHPNQKPVDLFEYLVQTYTVQGALVVDPYGGSGTTAIAARNTNRQYMTCDISPKYCELMRERLITEFGKRKQVQGERVDDLPLFASALEASLS